jgi:hypothetical protein
MKRSRAGGFAAVLASLVSLALVVPAMAVDITPGVYQGHGHFHGIPGDIHLVVHPGHAGGPAHLVEYNVTYVQRCDGGFGAPFYSHHRFDSRAGERHPISEDGTVTPVSYGNVRLHIAFSGSQATGSFRHPSGSQCDSGLNFDVPVAR